MCDLVHAAVSARSTAGFGACPARDLVLESRSHHSNVLTQLRAAANSRPKDVAGAIAGQVRDCGESAVRAIGAGAVNQAIKAVAVARTYLAADGIDAVCIPSFSEEVLIEGQERTALHLTIVPR